MTRLYDKFIAMFGDIKVFRFPFWIVYDPGSYRVKGPECRKIADLLEPGDILLRRYDGYLDSRFIPGVFSHAAIYLGNVEESDKAEVPNKGRVSRFFETGPCQVAHSTAEGVHLEDILTFCRCDDIAVIRLPDEIRKRNDLKKPIAHTKWHPDERAIHQRLEAGESVYRQEVVRLARRIALGNLGIEYDFAFDFHQGNRMSCTEFVFDCIKSANLGLGIFLHREPLLGGLTQRDLIEPDDFLQPPLRILHLSEPVKRVLQRARLPSPPPV
jgi:hypothetical protein